MAGHERGERGLTVVVELPPTSAYYGIAEYDRADYGVAIGDLFPEAPSNRVRAGGAYAVSTTLWRADRSGQRLERLPLDIPVQGTITFNEDTAPTRTFSLDVNHPSRLVPFQDYLIPETTLADAAGNTITRTLGHFIVTPPQERLTAARHSGTLEGRDLTWLLIKDTVPEGTVIPAGTDTGLAAREIARSVLDAHQVAIPDTGVLLSSDYEPEVRASRYAVMTELLATGARPHYRPWGDGDGIVRSAPYRDPQTAQAVRRYSTRERFARIVPPVTSNPDWERLRNRVTVANIRPDHEPVFATAEVTDRDSPVHPENLGGDPSRPLWFSETVYDHQVETHEAALAKAQLLLANGASWYRRLTIETVVDLDADAHDLIELDIAHQGASYTGTWIRRAWSVQLRGITATTTSELVRTERWRS